MSIRIAPSIPEFIDELKKLQANPPEEFEEFDKMATPTFQRGLAEAIKESGFKGVAKFYAKNSPKTWSNFYPRAYPEISGYTSPKIVSVLMMMNAMGRGLLCAKAGKLLEFDVTTENFASISATAIRYRVPTFFVSPELLTAMLRTEVPEDLNWGDAKFPFPAGFIYLPKGVWKNPDGLSVMVMGWLLADFDDCKGLAVQIICDDQDITQYSRDLNSKKNPTIRNLKEFKGNLDSDSLPMSEEEDEFVSRSAVLALSLLLMPSVRPELVERERRISPKKKGGREVWSPNFLGRTYKISKTTDDSTGTHASPRMHWRKGHYRNQKMGIGLTKTKIIWIEPMIVNADFG